MTSIYLIRHAQAQGNAQGRFQGHTDTPLTELGLEQAGLVAKRFAAIPLNAVYCSPLIRARQTAQAVAACHSLTPIVEPGIIEIDGGGMENMDIGEMREHYPVEWEQFDKQPHLFTGIGGGESILAVYERMVKAMGEIVDRHPDSTVAVVSHGCAIRCYLCFARAYPLERLGEVEWGRNTCVTHVTYHQGQVMLHRVNDTCHLEVDPTKVRP